MSESTQVEVDKDVLAQNALMQSADDLFAGTGSHEITLRTGKKVVIKSAKVKQLRQITAFVQTFLAALDQSAIAGIIAKVSKHQEDAINAGTDPYKLETRQVITDLIGEGGAISQLLQLGVDELPKLIPIFTDLSIEDVDELELDEAAVVGLGIFGRNYHFFIQQVAPVILAYTARLKGLAKKTTA